MMFGPFRVESNFGTSAILKNVSTDSSTLCSQYALVAYPGVEAT